jgi:hypothetical protein
MINSEITMSQPGRLAGHRPSKLFRVTFRKQCPTALHLDQDYSKLIGPTPKEIQQIQQTKDKDTLETMIKGKTYRH